MKIEGDAIFTEEKNNESTLLFSSEFEMYQRVKRKLQILRAQDAWMSKPENWTDSWILHKHTRTRRRECLLDLLIDCKADTHFYSGRLSLIEFVQVVFTGSSVCA